MNQSGEYLPAKGGSDALVYGASDYKKYIIDRVIDLTGAVQRCVDDAELNRETVGIMKTWARELLCQLDMLDTMLIYEE